MCRMMILIVCLFTSVVTSFADDSYMIAALRGEGLFTDSAVDPILAELTASDNDEATQQSGISKKANAVAIPRGIDNAKSINWADTSLVVQVDANKLNNSRADRK